MVEMSELKSVIGLIAIALVFVGYVPYIRDIVKGKTHPHAYSWFLWASVGLIIFALQLTAGGGVGAYVTLSAVIITYVIFGLGLRYGKAEITRTDTVFFVLALIGIGLWLLAKQPVLSVILLDAVEVLAFAPTIRKSWHRPHSETLSSYAMNSLRFGLALLAMAHYSVVTVLYPATWLVANVLFCVLLILRRRQVA